MDFDSRENEGDRWELDTLAYVETYRKEIILAGRNGIEYTYRLSLISDEGPCRKCGGIRFSYLVEVWDEQNDWVHMPEYDENYFCSNNVCDEDGLKPNEFERLFRSIQKESKYINLD